MSNLLFLPDYIQYLKDHRSPSARTLARYQDTLRVMGDDMKTVNPLDQPALYQKLLELLPKRGYGYISTYLTIFNALAKIDGHQIIRERNYHVLHDEINKLRGQPRAYTDSEISLISAALASSQVFNKTQLRKLMVLMLYSGLRVGACKDIPYDSVKQVAGHDVYTFPVHSKGMDYQAFISGNAWRFLQRNRFSSEHLVHFDSRFSMPFDQYFRRALLWVMLKKNLHETRKNTSVFHSFRKSYAEKLLATGLDPKDYIYAYLMGHVQRSKTATKFYIMADGTKVPLELLDRCATAYEKTTLQTSDLLLLEEKV